MEENKFNIDEEVIVDGHLTGIGDIEARVMYSSFHTFYNCYMYDVRDNQSRGWYVKEK